VSGFFAYLRYNDKFVHWANTGFTLGTITFNFDITVKILAFLFVTLPLGVTQWLALSDRLKQRRQANAKETKEGSDSTS
jgi:hypothetical protein